MAVKVLALSHEDTGSFLETNSIFSIQQSGKQMRQEHGSVAPSHAEEHGFSMVELMIVVAMLGILSSVAIPAYVNHINRSKQTEAVAALMNAKMEQELYYEDANRFRYARTIGCLPSFVTSANVGCLANCGSCGATTYRTGNGYVISVESAQGNTYKILAQKKLYINAATDVISLSSNTGKPFVQNDSAIGFSIFKWLFQ
jgi:type IV pilus assembly protein PilE